ncbi:MAG: hypothetical protein HXS53_06550 [Theionarchaea archaeon]|nr:hypothetical protein [Theionarchaea archaeon]
MDMWNIQLKVDPTDSLLQTEDMALIYFVRRDLQDQGDLPIESLWELPAVQKIMKIQNEDGSWTYPGKSKEKYPHVNYSLIETFRNLGILIEKFGFSIHHSRCRKAAEYCFSCQSEEGDFRGIYENQYSPNYTAAIMELLIKAGYARDHRIEKGFTWLLSVRQSDGGWAIPIRTHGVGNTIHWFSKNTSSEPLYPDISLPFSHMVTGVVLRAFAAHPRYGRSVQAYRAGELLASRFFLKDAYPDRGNESYWKKSSFPFWFTDIVSALDSLSLMGFRKEHPQVKKGLEWLKTTQQENGIFNLKLLRSGGNKNMKYWITLAICRIYKRLFL